MTVSDLRKKLARLPGHFNVTLCVEVSTDDYIEGEPAELVLNQAAKVVQITDFHTTLPNVSSSLSTSH